MTGGAPRKIRTIELELDLPRLVFAAALVLIVMAGAFLIGRASAPRTVAPAGASGVILPSPEGAVAELEDVGGSGGVFDRVGAGGGEREPSRQVTSEAAAGAGWQVELAAEASRREASRLEAVAERLGLPAMLAAKPSGGYAVAAGPFASRAEAERAARQLKLELGREVAVRDPVPR